MKRLFLITLIWMAAAPLRAQSPEDYFAEAAEHDPGLKARFETYQAALQRAPQVSGMPQPELSFGAFLIPVETRVGPQQARLTAMQMFPWMGALSSRRDAALKGAEAERMMAEAARNQLFYEIRADWYRLYLASRRQQRLDAHIRLLRTLEQLATSRFESGKAPLSDVLRVQSEIVELRNRWVTAREMEDLLRRRFNRRVGRDLSVRVSLPDTLEAPAAVTSREALLDSLHLANEQLRALRIRQESLQMGEEAARLEGKPMLGVGLTYIFTGPGGMDPAESGKDAVMPMVSVTLPLWRERYKAKQTELATQRRALEYEEEDMVRRLVDEFEMQAYKIAEAERRIQLNREQLDLLDRTRNLQLEAYSVDGKNFEEILRTDRMRLDQLMSIDEAQIDIFIALARIEALCGKF